MTYGEVTVIVMAIIIFLMLCFLAGAKVYEDFVVKRR